MLLTLVNALGGLCRGSLGSRRQRIGANMIGASSLLLPPPAARCPRAFSGITPSRAASAGSGPGGVHNVQQPGHNRSIRCQSSTGLGSEDSCSNPQAPIVTETVSASISRRSQLVLSSSLVVAGLVEHLATPGRASAGFERYIRKRKNDPLEFYIPVVLEAREQLADAEKILVSRPLEARELLRSGPFSGLRDNVRVMGEYAVENQKTTDATTLTSSFFRSLEDLDRLLAGVVRENKELTQDEASVALKKSLTALDNLLATVPEDIMQRSRQVLAVAQAKQAAAQEAIAAAAADALDTPLPAKSE